MNRRLRMGMIGGGPGSWPSFALGRPEPLTL